LKNQELTNLNNANYNSNNVEVNQGSNVILNSNLDNQIEEDLIRGELENLDSKTKSNYDALIHYIGEENLRKIFSNQIIFKEEGLDMLLKSLKEIFDKTIKEIHDNNQQENETSKIINLIMKLVFILMKDKHPHISIKTIDIFQNLLSIINNITITKKVTNLVYDLTVTDKILFKIKEKLGDANSKIRTKAIDLYCLLLRQNLCDYNNLLSELLEDELKHFDTKKIAKSPKTIIGKLSIFDNVFDEIQNALQDKRTDEKSFPFNSILKYVIENLTNSKSEIRKLARRILVKMYTVFGYKKIEPHLKKVDERELEKLVELVPEIIETLKNKQITLKLLQQNMIINSNITNNSQILPINNKSLLARKSLEKKKSYEMKNNSINNNNFNNNNKNNRSIEKKKVLGKYQIQTQKQTNGNENIEVIINKGKSAASRINNKNNNILIDTETGVQAENEANNNNGEEGKLKIELYNNDYLKNINNLNNSILSSYDKDPTPKSINSVKKLLNINKNKILICSYCGKSDESFINTKDIENHKNTDCPLFTNCKKCNSNLEVRLLNHHMISECQKKNENKICKRCKEPIEIVNYDEHIKNNNCNPAKNLNSCNRCPLCHKDIAPYDKGFVQHLVNDKCSKQIRKIK